MSDVLYEVLSFTLVCILIGFGVSFILGVVV